MKQIFIERRENLLRIAIKNEGKLQECFIEEENKEPQPGEIYKGIVKNIVPAIKCAFIDIGYEKNCYMYIDRKFNNTALKKNQEVLVEILKEGVGEKGPKVTNAVTIPGRYVVLETLNKKLSFSKRIENEEFKEYAKKHIEIPEAVGIMIRTKSENVSMEVINEEIRRLYEEYKNIIKQFNYSLRPKLIYNGEGALSRVLRDTLDELTEVIAVDNEKDYNFIKEFLKFSSDVNSSLQLHRNNKTLFNYYGIEKQILELRNKKVYLKSGGNIIIEKTEGMNVIDVNSAKNIKGASIKDTALITNIEAAVEIGSQIKLRNLGGIIIIDFIDMESLEDKRMVIDTLTNALKEDKNKTVIYPFTELNLVQIARRRRGKPILEYIEEDCHYCSGSGKHLKFSFLTVLIKNEIAEKCSELTAKDIYIEISNSYKEAIMADTYDFIQSIGAEDKSVYVNFILNLDNFKVEPLIFSKQIEKMQKFKIYG